MLNRGCIRSGVTWLGVCIGVAGLVGYVLSFLGPVSHTWGGDRRVTAGRGALAAYWAEGLVVPWKPEGGSTFEHGSHWRWLPVCGEHAVQSGIEWREGRLVVPYWVFLLIGAVAAYRLLPTGPRRGRCACGYDLRAVPHDKGDRVRCPECGVVAMD